MEPNYIGVDLHKQFFQACAITATGTRLWEGRFERTPTGLAQFEARCHTATQIAVEATAPTWTFVDAVGTTGATVCVVDPRKTKLKAGYAAKTDRLDARRLADALRRESVVSIYIPPPAIRELREVCRSRHQVVRVRARLAQMIRALLLRSGHADAPMHRLHSAAGLRWLQGVTLAPDAQQALARLTRILAGVHAEAQIAEALLLVRAAADPVARALDALVGIGPVLALTIRAEVGDITRFRNGPALACYAGLVPTVDRSADRGWTGRITRQGSPWLRWALVESTMHGMKRQDPLGRWARRLAVRTGGNKARVALARRLCDEVVQIWRRTTV